MARLTPKPSTIKRLFSLSGNRCAFPDCTNEHVLEGIVIGKVAHICAAEMDGPRYDMNMTDEDRRAFENLLILCPTHHDLVDKLSEKYPVSFLRKAKEDHEARHQASPYDVPDSVTDFIIDELNIIQSNTLHNGVQNNVQNIHVAGANIQDFLETAGEQEESAVTDQDTTDENGDDGTLENIERAVATIPEWIQTIQESSDVIASVAPVMNIAVKEMAQSDKRGGDIQGRIRVLKKTAASLTPIANRIHELGEKFDEQLTIVDRGMNSIIDLRTAADDGELESFAEDLRTLSSSADYGLGALDGLLGNMKPLEGITKDMKKPIATMKAGLELMRKGKPVINGWLDTIDGVIERKSQ